MYYENIRLPKELIFKQKWSGYTEHAEHIHDVLEISVLLEHHAIYNLLGKEYKGSPGDVFLFRPFEPHWPVMADEALPFQWIMILFAPSIVRMIPHGSRLLAPFYAVESINPLIPAASPYAAAIQLAASQAVEEEQAKRIGWEAKQFQYFIDILVSIYRYSFESKPIAEEGSVDSGMLKVIEHMLENFPQIIDMEPLIEMSGRKKTAFFAKFKAVTGLSPNEFIHRLRIQLALHLLEHTDRTITDIAYDCGYVTSSHFNNHFKELRGISPREHRKATKISD
ncbi:HTH-type transcriptional activator RhaS [compost metagenome]